MDDVVVSNNAVWLLWRRRLVPGAFGTIEQQDIARAIIGEFLHGRDGLTVLGIHEIRQRSRGLDPA